MLRWGILSTATVAQTHMIPAILQSTNGEVSAIASRDLAKSEAVAKRFRIGKTYGSYEAMIDDPDIDAIYIATPNALHQEWIRRAVYAGKHVLCEKPIAMHHSEIDEWIELSGRTGRQVSEAFMIAYHPQWQKVKTLLDEGRIGELRRVSATLCYPATDAKDIRNQSALGGGALRTIGSYPIFAARMVTGQEPEAVRGMLRISPEFNVDVDARFDVEFPGFELNFHVSTELAWHQSMRFHGTKGVIELASPFNIGLYDAARLTWTSASRDQSQSFEWHSLNPYQLQIEAFARAISGDANVVSLTDSRSNQVVVDRCFEDGREMACA